jgi:hypothetical protein
MAAGGFENSCFQTLSDAEIFAMRFHTAIQPPQPDKAL